MRRPARADDAQRAEHHPSSYFQQYAQPASAAPVDVDVQKPTGWFVVNWIFLWPLAVYSLFSAWAAIDRLLAAGDMPGAQNQANRVRKFGITALCLGLAVSLCFLIVELAAYTEATSTCRDGHC